MDDTVWHLIRDERQSLARTLEPLSAEQWATPSLCTQWTVLHVLAHLVMTPAGEPRAWPITKALVKARGHLWTAGRDVAVAYARRTPEELLATMCDLAEARSKPVFVASQNILLDLVVHGQDIAVPLGLERSVPTAAGRHTLERIWAMGWPFRARRRLDGVHLQYQSDPDSDVIWEAGSGPQVYGSAGDLALLMTGRTVAALPRLHGPGVEILASRLHPTGAQQ